MSPQSAKPEANWEVVYVLPNLAPSPDRWVTPADERSTDLLRTGIDLASDSLAIVPSHDPRVRTAAALDPKVARLLDVFVDVTGKKLHPAVLIAREHSPFTWEQDAIVAFRNCVAISVVLRYRAHWLRDKGSMDVGWSDYFDFHPLRVGTHGLVSDSPALTAIVTATGKYQAMPSPFVSATTPTSLWRDGFLYHTLSLEWRRFYEKPVDRTTYGRGLFRSLEIAYVASAAPNKHGGSVYEWGVQVALWVSAIEVLVSALHGGANERLSVELLGEYDWSQFRPSLRDANHAVKLGRKRTVLNVNVVQHACHVLYAVRNKFLHGNEVGENELFPWGVMLGPNGQPPASIIAVAPVVYRTALHAFLSRNYKPRVDEPQGDSTDVDPVLLASVMNEYVYAEALQSAYRIADQRTAQTRKVKLGQTHDEG
jgi:hypothetical protein